MNELCAAREVGFEPVQGSVGDADGGYGRLRRVEWHMILKAALKLRKMIIASTRRSRMRCPLFVSERMFRRPQCDRCYLEGDDSWARWSLLIFKVSTWKLQRYPEWIYLQWGRRAMSRWRWCTGSGGADSWRCSRRSLAAYYWSKRVMGWWTSDKWRRTRPSWSTLLTLSKPGEAGRPKLVHTQIELQWEVVDSGQLVKG